jgi:hypothetical protein
MLTSTTAPGGRFQPGQSGNPAGRPPGISDRRSRDVHGRVEALGIDPFEVLLLLAGDRWADLHPGEPEVDEVGQRRHVPLELRLRAAKEAAAFLHPRQKAVEHAVSEAAPFAQYMEMSEEQLRDRLAEINEALGDQEAA